MSLPFLVRMKTQNRATTHSEDSALDSHDQSARGFHTAASGMMEEEEIDEEEAALSAYVDALDEEGGFEEFEEETHAAGDQHESAHPPLIAASRRRYCTSLLCGTDFRRNCRNRTGRRRSG